MFRTLFSLTCLALFVTACDDQHSNSAVYHETAPKKPVVTMIPVIDSTEKQYSWDLSNELSALIHYQLSQKDQFYLVDITDARLKTKHLIDAQNPFGTDVSWIKKAFQGHEFVAFLELVEHEEVLRQDRQKKTDPKACAADLKMSMRVRVFDLRGKETKAIL